MKMNTTILTAANETIATLEQLQRDPKLRRDFGYRLTGCAGFQTAEGDIIEVENSPRVTACIGRCLDEAKTIQRLALTKDVDGVGAYFGRFPGETTEEEIVGRLECLAEGDEL